MQVTPIPRNMYDSVQDPFLSYFLLPYLRIVDSKCKATTMVFCPFEGGKTLNEFGNSPDGTAWFADTEVDTLGSEYNYPLSKLNDTSFSHSDVAFFETRLGLASHGPQYGVYTKKNRSEFMLTVVVCTELYIVVHVINFIRTHVSSIFSFRIKVKVRIVITTNNSIFIRFREPAEILKYIIPPSPERAVTMICYSRKKGN